MAAQLPVREDSEVGRACGVDLGRSNCERCGRRVLSERYSAHHCEPLDPDDLCQINSWGSSDLVTTRTSPRLCNRHPEQITFSRPDDDTSRFAKASSP